MDISVLVNYFPVIFQAEESGLVQQELSFMVLLFIAAMAI